MRFFGIGDRVPDALLVVVLGLGLATGTADAKSPHEDGGIPIETTATAADLAGLLAEISLTTVPADRRSAADAFIGAAMAANMDTVIGATLPALADHRDEQRYFALVGLGAAAMASNENGEELSDLAYVLAASLADTEAQVREAAAATLAAIQPAPPIWMADALVQLLSDPDRRVASAAARVLERMPANKSGYEAAYLALDAEDPASRSRATRLLGAYGGQSGDITPAWIITPGLDDPEAAVRWQTAAALGDMGDTSVVAVRSLWAVSRDETETPAIRRAAATAINSVLD